MKGGDVWLVRHGETAWTRTGQHTSRTDVALTDIGRTQAAALATVLSDHRFGLVLTSPRRRASETCDLAGFGSTAQSCDEVVEWDYGAYEGRSTAEIRAENPRWSLWTDGVPGGETVDEVEARADLVIERVRHLAGDALVFSHGHFLRVLAARWVGLRAKDGARFSLAPASLSILGWEREEPVVTRWNAELD